MDFQPKLKAGYLFPEIGQRVKAFCEANPEAAQRLIHRGIGSLAPERRSKMAKLGLRAMAGGLLAAYI
ncbi:MAG: hypothetical protein ABSD57_03210 [Verrucomicrobiota bacterium]